MGRLPEFEGCEVDRSSIKVTKAGDGLSEPLELDPQALAHGEDVYLVIRGRVTQVIHRPTRSDEPEVLTRVHVVEARDIALVAPDEVEGLLEREHARIDRLKAAKEGLTPLPGMDGGPAAAEGPANIFGGHSEPAS